MSERRNLYSHRIELRDLDVKNDDPDSFRQTLEDIPYRGYSVEELADGREIVITKPGGKRPYEYIKREDFMVWVYQPDDGSLWLISHKDIQKNFELKGEADADKTAALLSMLERVFSGHEPEEFLDEIKENDVPKGEPAELLFKAYKWIWGQEDCNYPDGEGRLMSMKGLRKLRSRLSGE